MISALKMVHFVFKMMDFALKMMNFAFKKAKFLERGASRGSDCAQQYSAGAI